MKVHLTFDIEIWCNGWTDLDARFPQAFERYVYGRSSHGDYALPATLATLQRHELQGVFFVEPLFAARFGTEHLRTIVRMIESAGQDVQLHLHPEWADEISPAPVDVAPGKRPCMWQYTADEQLRLILLGRQLLESECRSPLTAFRAGSYAADHATLHALGLAGLLVDSSLNAASSISGAGVTWPSALAGSFAVGAVQEYPVTVFSDGFGRARPAQVGACGLGEMQDALTCAEAVGLQSFVIVSHNFEMLKPGSSNPDRIVERRFDGLCHWLSQNSDRFEVGSFPALAASESVRVGAVHLRASKSATARRHVEQAARRLI